MDFRTREDQWLSWIQCTEKLLESALCTGIPYFLKISFVVLGPRILCRSGSVGGGDGIDDKRLDAQTLDSVSLLWSIHIWSTSMHAYEGGREIIMNWWIWCHQWLCRDDAWCHRPSPHRIMPLVNRLFCRIRDSYSNSRIQTDTDSNNNNTDKTDNLMFSRKSSEKEENMLSSRSASASKGDDGAAKALKAFIAVCCFIWPLSSYWYWIKGNERRAYNPTHMTYMHNAITAALFASRVNFLMNTFLPYWTNLLPSAHMEQRRILVRHIHLTVNEALLRANCAVPWTARGAANVKRCVRAVCQTCAYEASLPFPVSCSSARRPWNSLIWTICLNPLADYDFGIHGHV